jgi:hypothetical protein
MAYNLSDESSLTALKTKWMPLLQKHASKSLLKLGLILVGINFKTNLTDFTFDHKVALFARGSNLQQRQLTYQLIFPDSSKN